MKEKPVLRLFSLERKTMAFTNTKGRYASFGIVTSIPGELIDSIWFCIDNYLKHVIPLKHIIRFSIKNRSGKITLVFSQENFKHSVAVDFNLPFDPYYPRTILVIDRNGKETVTLPDEVNLI